MIKSLAAASYIIAIMTENFINDLSCKQIFLYATSQLGLKFKLILINKNFAWKKDEDIGVLCSDEVFRKNLTCLSIMFFFLF